MFMTKLKWTTVSAVMIVGAISGVSYVMAQGVDHGLSGQNLVLLAKADGIRLTALRPDGAVKQDTQLHKTSKGVMENMPQAIEVMKTAHGIAIRVAQPSQAGHTGMHKTHPVGGQKTK
ncbi:MAG: hypothetical protein JWQ02_2485 [Capsulimonas sp.]|nr:hypothetical protein [Capsulimonas sp.]